MLIRDERAEDYAAVRRTIIAAGGGDPDDPAATLVDLLRARDKTLISLVAEIDGSVVGHVMFSPMTIENAPDDLFSVGLAPLMVQPEFQGQGVGTALVEAGLGRCADTGVGLVFVLGSSKYYPRFGFSTARPHSLDNEYDDDEHFMVLELAPCALERAEGLVRFSPEFSELGC